MPILRRIVWSVFEIVDFSPGFDYVINWFLGAHGTLPERRAKYFDGAKAPTTQGFFTRPTTAGRDIVVERVARATLTNVDTIIDWVIDAPGLRPARDFRYGDVKYCIL